MREQEYLRRDVVKRVREQRERMRELSGRGILPVYEVGDYILVARVRKPRRVPMVVQIWTGPLHAVPGGSEHVRVVEDFVTGETKEVHVVRMRPYADSSLVVGREAQRLWEGGGGRHQFVPVLGEDGTKIAPPGNLFDQPPGEMS